VWQGEKVRKIPTTTTIHTHTHTSMTTINVKKSLHHSEQSLAMKILLDEEIHTVVAKSKPFLLIDLETFISV